MFMPEKVRNIFKRVGCQLFNNRSLIGTVMRMCSIKQTNKKMIFNEKLRAPKNLIRYFEK